MSTGTATFPADWREWPEEEKLRLLRWLQDQALLGWRSGARPDQLPPAQPWVTLFLRGGRGSGKTYAGARILAELIGNDPMRAAEGPGQWAVVAPTYGDVRDTCIEGESGLLAALGTSRVEVDAGLSALVRTYNRSMGELIFHDGSIVFMDGADDGGLRLQGKNLRGAWCDEIGLWRRWEQAWDESLGYALRKGESKVIATGTPKRHMPARKLVKRLLSDPNVVSRRLRTYDNLPNLSQAFLERVRRHEGTELARQELYGDLLEDIEGALWQRSWFEAEGFRVSEPPYGGWFGGPVVGVDPSDGNEDGAEQAYTVVALGGDHKLYVAESNGLRCTPPAFANEVLDVALGHHATHIVLEQNHGGAYLKEVFERVMRDRKAFVALRMVHASQGKRTRAEPVAALYEQGHVRHIGQHPELEDQLSNFQGVPGEVSPDRLDSLVWAFSEFTGRTFGPPLAGAEEVMLYEHVGGDPQAWQPLGYGG